ncbi:hypothetical protein [Blautia wexlerae]|nr:hypothetical protein [Blautia wexlerae]
MLLRTERINVINLNNLPMEKNDKPNNLRGFCTITLEDVFCLKNIAHSINAAFKEDWERAVMDEYQKKLNYIRDRKQQQRTGR